MLENNHLYRRIENKNLFHTFSRTYSRHTPLRDTRSQNQSNTITFPPDSSSSTLTPSQAATLLHNTKLGTLNTTTQLPQPRGSTAPIFKRSQPYARSETTFNNTLNLTQHQTAFEKAERYSSNPYLNSLIEKKKQRGSMLSDIKFGKKKQNFKLKECLKHDINYQTDHDQTDFSILEFNKQNQAKKSDRQSEGKSKATTQVGFYQTQLTGKGIGLGLGLEREVRMQVGRRIAAHLFNKYTRGMEQVNGKKLSINNSLQRCY